MSRFRPAVSLFTLLFFFLPVLPSGYANLDNVSKNDHGNADFNQDRTLDHAGRRSSGDNGQFGVGTPEDWERDASAAFVAEAKDGETPKDAVDRERAEIDEQYQEEDKAEQERWQRELDEFDRVQKEESERQARLEKLDREKLERDRADSQRAIDNFNKLNGPASGWTAEQQEKYEKLVQENARLNEPTEQDNQEIERRQQIRDQVYKDIRTGAMNMGGLSEDEIRARQDAYNMSDAATKTWRDATFTGKMVSEVSKDTFNQREQGIMANNMVISADVYLKNPNLTPEQRAAAESVKKLAMGQRQNAAEAIVNNGAVVIAGMAADAATLAVARPASFVAGKVAGALAPAATEVTVDAAAGAAKVGAGEAAGQTAGRTAGTETGQVAGRTGGAEAGQAAGGKLPSQMTQAEAQAYNDAQAAKAVHEGWTGGKPMPNPGDSVVMPAGSTQAANELQAVKNSVGELAQNQIDDLFKPGANLTPTQVIQKAEILAQREAAAAAMGTNANNLPLKAYPGFSSPATSGVMPGAGTAAGEGTQAFNGALTTPHAAGTGPMGTQVLPGAGQAAGSSAGGATQAFPQTLPIPAGQGAGKIATAATEGGTQVGMQAAGSSSGGTTQAFNQVLPAPGQAAGSASSGGTQVFNQTLSLPPGQGASRVTTAGSEAATAVFRSGEAAGEGTQAYTAGPPKSR